MGLSSSQDSSASVSPEAGLHRHPIGSVDHVDKEAVAAELGAQQDATLQAALMFELGALHERVGHAAEALAHYVSAETCDARFRPPLFARARLLRGNRDHRALLQVLAKLARASAGSPGDQASFLLEIGCLFEDQLGDYAASQRAFERALRTDPTNLAAAAMVERAWLSKNRRRDSHAVLAARAGHTLDAKLRSALAVEAARGLAAEGDVDKAIVTLLRALGMRGAQLPTLLCLVDLSLAHGRTLVAARAYQDLGWLLASYAADPSSVHEDEIGARYPAPLRAASFYYYRAALLFTETEGEHGSDALRALERAAHCSPNDVLFGLSLASFYRALDDDSSALTSLESLVTHVDPHVRAVAAFDLAELAERCEDPVRALQYLRLSHAALPDAASVQAIFEDRLLDAQHFGELSQLLSERAQASTRESQRVLLARATLAAERAGDLHRAIELGCEFADMSEGSDRTFALRTLHDLAAHAGDSALLDAVTERLLDGPIPQTERSAVLHARFEAAWAAQSSAALHACLQQARSDRACDAWTPHASWLTGAVYADHGLLAMAHAELAQLAEQHDQPQLAAAHTAARGRVLLRAGELGEALSTLRRALTLAPGHAYTRGLVERCLQLYDAGADALSLLHESELEENDAHVHQAALLHEGHTAEAAGQLERARHAYDAAVEQDPSAFEAQWARLRFAEHDNDAVRRLLSLRALAEREENAKRPGSAHLELGEALSAGGEFEAGALRLAGALDNDAIAFEAAASAVLLPRGSRADALRPRALSVLSQRGSGELRSQPGSDKLRRTLEHECSAELLHVRPADARPLLGKAAQHEDGPEALLRFLLQEDSHDNQEVSIAGLRALTNPDAEREQEAELALHAARVRALRLNQRQDTDLVASALALHERAPDTLASALAMCEALSAADDADTRTQALHAWLEHLPEAESTDVLAALARALIDAGSARSALSVHDELLRRLPDDPSVWESYRVAARAAGDYAQVVVACDMLAKHTKQRTVRADLHYEAAAVLDERLNDRAQAECRLREILAEVPEHRPAFERLHDVLVEREDLDGLLTLLSTRIQRTDSDGERLDLLYEQARIQRARDDRAAALASCEALLTQDPAHAGALGLQAEIHATEERFGLAVESLTRLATAEVTPAQRRLALESSADFLEHKLNDPAGAYSQLAKLVSLDLGDFGVHVRMARLAERLADEPASYTDGSVLPHAHVIDGVEVATDRREWTGQAAETLERAAARSRGGAQRALYERRAASYHLSLGQTDLARAALRRALHAHPEDEPAFSQLYALLDAADEALQRSALVDEFVTSLRARLMADPNDPDALRKLLRTGALSGRPSLTRVGLFALEALVQTTHEERLAAERLRQSLTQLPAGQLDDDSFKQFLPRDFSPALLSLGRAVSAAWFELTSDHAQRRPVLEPSTGPLRGALATLLRFWKVEHMDVTVATRAEEPALHLQRRMPAPRWVVETPPADVPQATVLVRSAPLMAASRAELLGLAAEDAADITGRVQRVLAAAGLLDDKDAQRERAALLGTGNNSKLKKLSRATRSQVRAAWERIGDKSSAAHRLAQGMLSLSRRAALIVSGDLVAVLLAGGDAASLREASLAPSGLELLRFWLSPSCAELLDRRGVNP